MPPTIGTGYPHCVFGGETNDVCSDSTGNMGAWINLKSDLKMQFQTFEAVPHPNVKPMAYASNLVGSMM